MTPPRGVEDAAPYKLHCMFPYEPKITRYTLMMYHEKPRQRKVPLASLVPVVAVAAAAGQVSRDMDAQAAAALKDSVVQAAVQCYAVEGAYPESVDYLEQNYGLHINHKRYIVSYSAFASNVMPDVQVLEK